MTGVQTCALPIWKAYFVYYTPIKDDTGAIVGMFFTGIPRTEFENALKASMMTMLILAGILLVTIIQVFTDMRRECLTLESSAAA